MTGSLLGLLYFTFCPEKTQRHFLFKAVRVDMWQRELGRRWEFEADSL